MCVVDFFSGNVFDLLLRFFEGFFFFFDWCFLRLEDDGAMGKR